VALVRRLAEFTNAYPWQWQPADAEEFIVGLRSAVGRRPIVMSTARGYEAAITLFMDYVTDRRYGWTQMCQQRFGQLPQQVFHDGNTVAHVADFEGQPGRRPLTYDEVQALFDAADARAAQIRDRGRKGALAALRDAALLKTIYAYGLRRAETRGLDLADRRHVPKISSSPTRRFGSGNCRSGARVGLRGQSRAKDFRQLCTRLRTPTAGSTTRARASRCAGCWPASVATGASCRPGGAPRCALPTSPRSSPPWTPSSSWPPPATTSCS